MNMMDEDKNELSIVGFSYHNKSFHVIFNEEEYQKIHHGDIIVKNEITKQERTFKFIEEKNNAKIFIFENIQLLIEKKEQ